MAATASLAPVKNYLSSPSSPKRSLSSPSGCYLYASAPASPSRAAAMFKDLAFEWEAKPGEAVLHDDAFDFAIFSVQLEREGLAAPPLLATADELFEDGMIRPLNSTPPSRRRSLNDEGSGSAAGTSKALNAMEEETKRDQEKASSRIRRGTRSLSPLRSGERNLQRSQNPPLSPTSSTGSSFTNSSWVANSGAGRNKKWSLRDMFLFRSASEGRATGKGSKESKDCLRKYGMLSSCLSSPSSMSFLQLFFSKRRSAGEISSKKGSVSTSSSTMNGSARGGSRTAAAASEELKKNKKKKKKKMPLPYQSNTMFDCLRFSPVLHSIGRSSVNLLPHGELSREDA